MENLSPQENPRSSIIFDNSCFKQLNVTRKWTKFLSIVGFVFLTGMTIIVGLVLSQFFSNANSGIPLLAILPSLLLAVVYFFPIYFLSKFSVHSKIALDTSSTKSLSDALRYLKLHYTFMGVLVIAVVALYIVVYAVMIQVSGGLNFFKLWLF